MLRRKKALRISEQVTGEMAQWVVFAVQTRVLMFRFASPCTHVYVFLYVQVHARHGMVVRTWYPIPWAMETGAPWSWLAGSVGERHCL